jgi:hypothetical protein
MHGFKTLIYIISLVLVLLPFILVTDLFPFFRFGMFAEPVKTKVQTEKFLVTFEKNGKRYVFNPKKYELPDETFQYLARNYYYRKQGSLLLEKLRSAVDSTNHHWQLFKVTFDPSFPEKTDTLLSSQI